MVDFLVRRALISIVTLIVISLIVFTGVRLIPGDPARVMGGTDADPAGLEEIRQKYGLNDPVVVQYLRWVGLALRGGAAQHHLGSARQRRVLVRDLDPELLARHHADPAPGRPAGLAACLRVRPVLAAASGQSGAHGDAGVRPRRRA